MTDDDSTTALERKWDDLAQRLHVLARLADEMDSDEDLAPLIEELQFMAAFVYGVARQLYSEGEHLGATRAQIIGARLTRAIRVALQIEQAPPGWREEWRRQHR